MVIMNGPRKSLSEGFKLIHDVLRPTGFVLEPHAYNIQLEQETAYRYYESPWYDYECYEFRTDAPGFGSEITDDTTIILYVSPIDHYEGCLSKIRPKACTN